MTRTLLILMMLGCLQGCVSRSQFRDRMDNMADVHSHDWLRLQRQINEQASQIETLEKKVEERKEPCVSTGSMTDEEWQKYFDSLTMEKIEKERPNYPCPYCDGSEPK